MAENKNIENVIKVIYDSMHSVCLDSILIGRYHYTIVEDGELMVEKRMEKCEKQIIACNKIHSLIVEGVKRMYEMQKDQDYTRIKLMTKYLLGGMKNYIDIVKTQQEGSEDTFNYSVERKFLKYPEHELFQSLYTYKHIFVEIEKMKNLLENMEIKSTNLYGINFKDIFIDHLPQMTYEEKNRRAIQILKQFGLKF